MFVAMKDEKTCGHQHNTKSKAFNCGGNVFKVISKPDKDDPKERKVTFKEIKYG